MRKPRNLSAVLSTAPIPLGLAVVSFYFVSLSLAPKSHKGRAPVTIQEAEACR